MIESARTTLGGIKKILNHQKCPNKAGGMKKNPKDPKTIFEQKKKPNQMLNQMKKTKTKKESSSPTPGGTINHFGKTIQKTKGQETSISDPQS